MSDLHDWLWIKEWFAWLLRVMYITHVLTITWCHSFIRDWRISVCHDSFIRDIPCTRNTAYIQPKIWISRKRHGTRLVHTWHDWSTCAMTHLHVTWLIRLICMWHDPFRCAMTRSYVTCLIHTSQWKYTTIKSEDCEQIMVHDAFIRDITQTHSNQSYDLFTWAMTHSYVTYLMHPPPPRAAQRCACLTNEWLDHTRHDLFMNDMTYLWMTWLVYIRHVPYIYMHVTWLILNDVTCLWMTYFMYEWRDYEWHDVCMNHRTCIYKTYALYVSDSFTCALHMSDSTWHDLFWNDGTYLWMTRLIDEELDKSARTPSWGCGLSTSYGHAVTLLCSSTGFLSLELVL